MSAPLHLVEVDTANKAEYDDMATKNAVHVTDMTAEDRAYELKRALEADPGIPVKSLRFAQLTGMMMIVCMCGGDAGEFQMVPS
jgi:hypothetical protein